MSDFPPIIFTENNLKAIRLLYEAKKVDGEARINLLTQGISLNPQYAEAYYLRAEAYYSVRMWYKAGINKRIWHNLSIPFHQNSHSLGSFTWLCITGNTSQLSQQELKELEENERQANIRESELRQKPDPSPWQEAIWLHNHGDYRRACSQFANSISASLDASQKEYKSKYQDAYSDTKSPPWWM